MRNAEREPCTDFPFDWRRIVNAPEDLNGFFAFLVVPPIPLFPAELHGKKMCGVVWCYSGPPEKADQVSSAKTATPLSADSKPRMTFNRERNNPGTQPSLRQRS